jgi:hypothetical protein
MIAVVTSDHVLMVMEKKGDRKERLLFRITEHKVTQNPCCFRSLSLWGGLTQTQSPVTALEWAQGTQVLFSGDEEGQVFLSDFQKVALGTVPTSSRASRASRANLFVGALLPTRPALSVRGPYRPAAAHEGLFAHFFSRPCRRDRLS